jgi:hypothetical protein
MKLCESFHVFIDILEIVAYKRPQNYLLASWPFIRYNFQNTNKNMK